MSTFSIKIKRNKEADFGEIMTMTYADKEIDRTHLYFDLEQLTEFLSKKGFDISVDYYASGEKLRQMIEDIKQEIERLLIEKEKNLLIGQYPPHAIRNMNATVLGKEYTFNIRNQWHDYILALDHLYQAFLRVEIENGGEVAFRHFT